MIDKIDSVKKTLIIDRPVNETFNLFINIGDWWPKEYTWSKEKLENIFIEQKKNGMCIEKGPFNFECDWGRVIHWNPPYGLVFTWQISPKREPEPNPDKASEVEVNFTEEENSRTRVELEHRCFEKHGDDAKEYREALDSELGWKYILNRYEEYVCAS